MNKSYSLLLAVIIAVAGGGIFTLLHIPVSWLLGSITSIMLYSIISKKTLYWPKSFRNIGIFIIGYSMGLSLTKEAMVFILHQLPSMLFLTVLIIGFSLITSFFIAKLTGIHYPSILLGSIPGGLSQMLVLAEETKEMNVTVVTFLQVVRLILIIFFVPFLIFGPFFHNGGNILPTYEHTASWQQLLPDIIPFMILSFILAIIFKKWNAPTPFLLGPIIATSLMTLLNINGPELPNSLLEIAQVFIGINIGLMMHPEKLENKWKLLSLGALSSALLIVISMVLSFLLSHFYGFSLATSFLSLSPGGMDQMAIIAHEVDAQLAVVTGYQLFRVFFIFFIVPPCLKYLFFRYRKEKG
ncbi:AbrB family transcriptional regulator [Cytobacillus sp. FSL W7-1323]|uniref:AbrB family transcriptional regulator n=1 Tax=Cytobacillus kochii TaxID=859143 RepID=A0A248TMT6_9BACI|nr:MULTISPECIES: AbrB family transcriptional regulator [Cytobacillus]ASV69517.1 AbrB family transcriptional regulator [Cytobacillus kochii]MDQ0184294.1 membrane AbrB-like protein [Cytobacillus kochii]MEA1852529.1 AbrB family transcriptional regulator [Cytobacillus sp. OWB-43]MED1604597.1 AbrB family transcriptional regulator [Cytobacillus kochii]